jgi:hypothetical protein
VHGLGEYGLAREEVSTDRLERGNARRVRRVATREQRDQRVSRAS